MCLLSPNTLERIQIMNYKQSIQAVFLFGALLSSAASPALATQTKVIANCSGDKHVSYLQLRDVYGSEGLAQTLIDVAKYNDSEPKGLFVIDEVYKNAQPLQPKAFSWAIRQAMKADTEGTWYGYLKVKAVSASGLVVYLNLQKYNGAGNALVIDGDVEQLSCRLAQGAE
jgi:hypothetical protein